MGICGESVRGRMEEGESMERGEEEEMERWRAEGKMEVEEEMRMRERRKGGPRWQ